MKEPVDILKPEDSRPSNKLTPKQRDNLRSAALDMHHEGVELLHAPGSSADEMREAREQLIESRRMLVHANLGIIPGGSA